MKTILAATLAALATKLVPMSLAGPIQLHSDIHNLAPLTHQNTQDPSPVVDLNGVGIFFAADYSLGACLWRSDGTAAGTYQLKTFWDYTGSSIIWPELVKRGDHAYFNGKTSPGVEELWRTDGTVAGTTVAVPAAVGGYAPVGLIFHQGSLYYFSYDAAEAFLVRSDGSAAGTVKLATFPVGIPVGLLGSGQEVVAFLETPAGLQIWKSGGLPETTALATTLANTIFSQAVPPAAVGGKVYFSAQVLGGSATLRVTDGTSAGTAVVAVPDLTNPTYLTAFGGQLYFSAEQPVSGRELWRSDGTVAGTQLVVDLVPGAENGLDPFAWLFTHDGRLLFARMEDPNLPVLWQSDGTAAGTSRLFPALYSYPVGAAQGFLHVTAELSGQTYGFYRMVAGYPTLVHSEISPIHVFELAGGAYFFQRNAADQFRQELWQTDGTAAGTQKVTTIQQPRLQPPPQGSNPRHLRSRGTNELWFVATDDTRGDSLWQQFGAGTPSNRVEQFANGGPQSLTAAGNYLFGATDKLNSGVELWGGVGANFSQIREIRSGSAGSSPREITRLRDGVVVFSADDGVNGRELWVSDGSSFGTALLKNIRPGSASSNPTQLILANNVIYFFADNGTSGAELWRTDGTPTGTYLAMEIRPGALGSLPAQPQPGLVVDNATLLMVADDGTHGPELWKFRTQPNEFAGSLVADLTPGAGNAPPQFLCRHANNDVVYFAAWDPVKGQCLWKYEPNWVQSPGPTFIADPSPYVTQPAISQIIVHDSNDRYCVVDHPSYGRELWNFRDSGLARLTRDINPGSASSNPQGFLAIPHVLCFSADDGTHGRELWATSFGGERTRLVDDLTNDSTGSDPTEMTYFGEAIYFAATRADVGRELFRISYWDLTSAAWAVWRDGYFPYGTNPALEAPEADPDGDGQTNLLEFALGRNPTLPDRKGAGTLRGGAAPTFEIELSQNVDYAKLGVVLESTQNLAFGPWTPLLSTAQRQITPMGRLILTWQLPALEGVGFYRVRVTGW